MFRNAIAASLAGPSTINRLPILRPVVYTYYRSFQTTTPVFKKRKALDLEEEFDNAADQEDSTSLFDEIQLTSSSSDPTIDRKTRRANYKSKIHDVAKLKGQARKEGIAELRVGSLRKVIQLSDTKEELEEFRGLLRVWRVLGGRVTVQTAREIIGRCVNLGHPELAQELSEDRLQYGFPDVPEASQLKLKAALANLTTASTTAEPAPAKDAE